MRMVSFVAVVVVVVGVDVGELSLLPIITLSRHEVPRPESNRHPPNDPTRGNVDRRGSQTQGTLLSFDLVKVYK